jgi:hypothetical protein
MQGLQFQHTHPLLSLNACRSCTSNLVYKLHPVRKEEAEEEEEEEEEEEATDESVFL